MLSHRNSHDEIPGIRGGPTRGEGGGEGHEPIVVTRADEASARKKGGGGGGGSRGKGHDSLGLSFNLELTAAERSGDVCLNPGP